MYSMYKTEGLFSGNIEASQNSRILRSIHFLRPLNGNILIKVI